MTLDAEAAAHYLRLFGVGAAANETGSVIVNGVRRVRVLLTPHDDALRTFGIRARQHDGTREPFSFPAFDRMSWSSANSLHPYASYECANPHRVAAIDSRGNACWLIVDAPNETLVIVGTELAGDVRRYRQGDPAKAANRPSEVMWGIAGERPNYLFEGQQPDPNDRQADWWCMALSMTVAEAARTTPAPLLPGGAAGAIVVTGDDDQAFLEKYRDQLEALRGVPVTYFLHPLTRHTPSTVTEMRGRSRIELGLHPDALDRPDKYSETFREQAAWFTRAFGARATLVRNHGFLNDGYWGHLPVWLEQGVVASANIPGVDGKVVNGSLLPARVIAGDTLTPHWSILTPIGDGVRFALGLSGAESAACITNLAQKVLDSRLPGVIVLNLHPQNIAETIEMHEAVHDVIAKGFLALTLGECIEWFDARDRSLKSAA